MVPEDLLTGFVNYSSAEYLVEKMDRPDLDAGDNVFSSRRVHAPPPPDVRRFDTPLESDDKDDDMDDDYQAGPENATGATTVDGVRYVIRTGGRVIGQMVKQRHFT